MNSIERVMAALQGIEKDRTPLSLTLSLYGAVLTDCPLHEYYTDSKRYVAGQIQNFQEIGPDIIFSPFALPLFGKAFGSQVRFFEDQAPNLQKPFIKNIEDIKNLNFSKALESKEISYIIECVEGLHKKIGNEAVICAIVSSPLDLPVMFMGLENWLDLLLSDFDEAKRLIDKTSKFFMKLTNILFDKGATGVVLPTIFLNPTIVTKSIAEELLDYCKNVFGGTKGPLFLHSGGARMIPFLEMYSNLPNVHGFVINSDDNILQARELLPNGQVIIGNIEGPDLNLYNPEQVYDLTIKKCQEMQVDKHHILGSSGADIPFDTPIENLKAISQAVKDISGK